MTMREIKGHEANDMNKSLRVQAIDAPGHGGACHEYLVEQRDGRRSWMINFQNGPIAVAGVNGLTHEVLIAILMDRLDGFQKGDYACKENAEAFHHLDMARGWLTSRTRRRVDAGVEGTHDKTEGDGDAPPHHLLKKTVDLDTPYGGMQASGGGMMPGAVNEVPVGDDGGYMQGDPLPPSDPPPLNPATEEPHVGGGKKRKS